MAQDLQERLWQMEQELRSARDQAQQQDRIIQNLSDALGAKESEVSRSRTQEVPGPNPAGPNPVGSVCRSLSCSS